MPTHDPPDDTTRPPERRPRSSSSGLFWQPIGTQEMARFQRWYEQEFGDEAETSHSALHEKLEEEP